jgi:hypothetical protein
MKGYPHRGAMRPEVPLLHHAPLRGAGGDLRKIVDLGQFAVSNGMGVAQMRNLVHTKEGRRGEGSVGCDSTKGHYRRSDSNHCPRSPQRLTALSHGHRPRAFAHRGRQYRPSIGAHVGTSD